MSNHPSGPYEPNNARFPLSEFYPDEDNALAEGIAIIPATPDGNGHDPSGTVPAEALSEAEGRQGIVDTALVAINPDFGTWALLAPHGPPYDGDPRRERHLWIHDALFRPPPVDRRDLITRTRALADTF